MMIVDFNKKLDKMISDAKCELNYSRDYELVIATVLSAQCTDKRVNEVTKELFSSYDIYGLAKADKKDIERIIRSCGSYTKKSLYIIEIAKSLIENYNGGPVGLETLAAAIGEEAVTLEDVCEPYLMQLGFISRTPRGRCVTALAYEHLGLTPNKKVNPSDDGQQSLL